MGLLSLDFSVEISDCRFQILKSRNSRAGKAKASRLLLYTARNRFKLVPAPAMFLDADPVEQD
jgi:hypothetical protein